MSKTYTLELTAEELGVVATSDSNVGHVLRPKLFALREQARADREADDLRLPWRAAESPGSTHERTFWYLHRHPRGEIPTTERVSKLMSAAPELLEAVKAADSWGAEQTAGTAWWTRWCKQVRPLIERALRKVETGVPE